MAPDAPLGETREMNLGVTPSVVCWSEDVCGSLSSGVLATTSLSSLAICWASNPSRKVKFSAFLL